MSVDELTGDRTGRGTAARGFTFVVLLLVSAGMASVPGGKDSVERVRDFYTAHVGIVVTAQVVGLLAAAVFVLFARSLARSSHIADRASWVQGCGYAVAAAAVLTAIPVLLLCDVANDGSDRFVHRLAQASDVVDVVLFAAIAAFAASVATATRLVWLRWLAWVVAVVALARAVLLAGGSGALELVGPLAFIALVLALSTVALMRPRHP